MTRMSRLFLNAAVFLTALTLVPSAIAQGPSVSPLMLNNSAMTGGPRPSQRLIFVNVGTTPATFTTRVLGAATGDPVPTWTALNLTGGVTPAVIEVFFNQAGLQPGTYRARVEVVVGGTTTLVDVVLQVTAGTSGLDVMPAALRFMGSASAPLLSPTRSRPAGVTLEQPILVSNKGGAALAFTATVVNGSSWIKGVTPASGQATGTATVLKVQVDTTGLATGTYVDEVRISSSAGSVSIPITLVVNGPGPLLALDTRGVYFAARQNQGSSQLHTIRVLDLGDPGTVVNWTARVLRGAGPVRLGQTSGTSRVGVSSNLDLTLADGATAQTGPQFSLIEIADPQALNSPQYAVAVVNVTSNTPPEPLVFPAASPVLRLDVSSTQPVPYTAAVSAPANLGVTITPASGNVSSASPAMLQVRVTGTPAPGVYFASVTIALGNELRNFFVTIIVAAVAGDAPQRNLAGCTPTRVVVAPLGLPNGFSVPAGWPATIVAALVDNCGEPVTNGNMIATFSNGDAPLSMTGDGTGIYSATWQPGIAQSGASVRLTGVAGTFAASSFEITGNVSANAAAPPVLAPRGIIHNLNPILGAPLAPGTVIQIYGDNFAPANQSAAAVPLPTVLTGAEAIVGPTSSPLYFVSKGQLTAQLASELTANRTYSAVIVANNAFTLPEPVDLVTLTPGVVQFPDGKLVAQHSDFSLVTADKPAKPGESLVIYLVGMGATEPAVPSGTASPGSPLAFTKVKPEVTVAGQSAELSFWGLTPGGVGLYQINFKVPDGAQTGELEVRITQGGAKANVTKLVVAR